MKSSCGSSSFFLRSNRNSISRFTLISTTLLLLLAFLVNTAESGGNVNNEELYNLLKVAKTATTKEIRVAFKKIALEKHPDKNPDDPKANEIFVKINRAYEVLKDEDLRKKYDQFGEEGLKDNFNAGSNYQSWNFYQNSFGIYDDDPDVITLSRSDFMQTVENTQTIWFINFYSAQCSHCHELAPAWRELAKQLSGVVKIGAVNCMDDWMLCNEQQIPAFPTLIIYPKRERFTDTKTFEKLLKFTLSFASVNVFDLSQHNDYLKQLNAEAHRDKPWLISFCLTNDENDDSTESNSKDASEDTELNYELNCLDESVQQKVAIMLDGLVRVGSINCANKETRKRICSKLKPKKSSPLVFYKKLPNITKELGETSPIEILTTDYKQIAQYIYSFLPDIKVLSEESFEAVLEKLKDKSAFENPWLIQFVYGFDTINDIELKKLPFLLTPNYNFARVDCSTTSICMRYQLSKYPTYILFKSASSILGNENLDMSENWYDVHYGSRNTPDDLASFVRENANAPIRSLTQVDLDNLSSSGNKFGIFIDFFAPWCPPCMSLLPEFRKASKLDQSQSFLFGTVDCTANPNLCAKYGVRSYPTTILFNKTTPHNYHGQHRANDLADFVQDILKPSVISLDYDKFHELVAKKPQGKIWFITFSANWCGPCQQLAPEWRKMAKKLDKNIAFVGAVDCAIEQNLCAEQQVPSYPNIRVYPATTTGINSFEHYQGWNRDVNSLYQWATNYLPSKAIRLDWQNFHNLILKQEPTDELPWVVAFSAPWCGHCQTFAPVFETVAGKFEGRLRFGKVNCQEQQHICQMAQIRAFPTIIFYKIATTKPSNSNDWRTGDGIEAYEVHTLTSVLESKLKSYGYTNKAKKESNKAKNDEL